MNEGGEKGSGRRPGKDELKEMKEMQIQLQSQLNSMQQQFIQKLNGLTQIK